MLILTRRIGETVVVGDETFITVLSVKGNQVRLGCKAPTAISVHRQEIHDRIQKELLRQRPEQLERQEKQDVTEETEQ